MHPSLTPLKPHRLRDITSLGAALVALSVLLWLALPAAARAAPCESPPGTSGTEEYCEQIPGPGGNNPPFSNGDGRGDGRGGSRGAGGSDGRGVRGGGSSIPPETIAALRRAGQDGVAVVGLGRFSGAPSTRGRSDRGNDRDRQGAAGSGVDGAPAPSTNPFDAIGSAVQPGAESGAGFGWILAGLFVVCCALAWRRYRRSAERGPSGTA